MATHTELQIRTAIADFISTVATNVQNRPRAKINPVQFAMLLLSTGGEPLNGVIVQYQGKNDEPDDDLSLVQRKYRYAIHVLLRYNDTATTDTTSEDDFNALLQSISDVFLQTQSLGLSGDIQHDYVQEVNEPEVLPTEEAGHFHYAVAELVVTNWIPASYC